MAAIDFARLRNQTMADGLDSEVTVNTRALIDKVLARYSSEHTTLRELIQNAADAKADRVIIKFETDPSLTVPTPQGAEDPVLLKHIIQNHTLKRLVVSNNGQPFTIADWSRLKSIADGNPDETKIGAFGVGFYSVFSDCDEPFVISGDRTMAFYWKGNMLSTKAAPVPPEHDTRDTIFMLEYRQANPASPSYNPSKLPNLPTLCQFLATSLTFVGLQSIELHVDDYVVASFTKKISPPEYVRVPPGLKTETEGGLMRVTDVTRQHSQLDAAWMNVIATAQIPPKKAADLVQQEVRNAGSTLRSFFSKFSAPPPAPTKTVKPAQEKANPSEEIAGDSKGTIFLQVCTVVAATKVSRNFAAEIERATKKSPPKTTKIALLTSPYQDPSATLATGSGSSAGLASKIFAEVLPTKSGRIFIGFPTAQTTGYLAHISAPSLIPTVERENVDMNARYISTWNIELLRVAGLACRITYAAELAALQAQFGKEPLESLITKTAYVFQQYTAKSSHPSTALGDRIDEAFWNCSKERSIDILSTKGVMPSKRIRMPAETLSFLGEVPMVPQELANAAVDFMLNLHNRGFITELTMQDIQQGLESRALNEDELSEFLKWCGSKLENGEIDVPGSRSLFENTVANIDVEPEKNSGRILALGDISTFVNPARIGPHLPLPSDTIPYSFTRGMSMKQLQMFGWIELSMVRWLRHMTTQPQLQEFTTDENLALSVLTLTSKCWEQLDGNSRDSVIKILASQTIMPTKMGMRRPAESYFPTVKLFDDLPTVKPFAGSKEKFLLSLGVRKTIDLPMVFDRMRSRDVEQSEKSERPSWNHVDLIRYFASVINEIPRKDLDRLRETAFLPGEGSEVKPGQQFKASDLYAPDTAIVSLGLTQIKLPFEFKPTTREGLLLLNLGLRQWPDSITIANILHRAGQANDFQLYTRAMDYLLANYYKNNYTAEANKFAALTLPILPTEQAPFPALVGPFQCYTNEHSACLGFPILRSDLRSHAEKLGVQRDPSIGPCVQYLMKTPPKSKLDAEMQFAYLASRGSDLDHYKGLINNLATANIVPIFRKYYLDSSCSGFEDRSKHQTGKTEMRIHHYDPPEHVFVGRDQEYRGILDYVHYGAEATVFLLKVGAKHEPTTHDLAYLLAKNPSRFLNTIGQEKYLDLLRKLAEHTANLWKDKDLVKALVASRLLLGYRDIKEDTKKVEAGDEDMDDLDEDNVHREWSLNKASEIVIIDNVNYMTRFRDFIIAAPQEELLEEFYARFGVQKVSELVKTDQRIGTVTRDQTPAQDLRRDILERVRLFLHEYERDASSKAIRHDAKWLGSNLTVQCVSDISIRYSLAERNVATSSKKSAVIIKVRSTGYVLNITPKYDLYEVSSELVRLLVSRPKRNDAIALERILTEPLRRLQQKGINVERILRRKEHEARIAKQAEQEREEEEQQKMAEQAKSGLIKSEAGENNPPATPATPEKSNHIPGAFGSPDTGMEVANNRSQPEDNGLINNWAKKLGFKNTPAPRSGGTDGPQISRDIQATKSNIQNAIKECRPTGMSNINTKHHQDPTELDRGGYCTGEQWENLHKAFSVPFSGRHVDVYYGRDETAPLSELQSHLKAFLPLIFGLTSIFSVNPAAVNIFLDKKSNTVAFNLSGSLFFNLAWFMALHSEGCQTKEGKLRALDSWFCTYCHELAHNLVADHDARHSWYQQQIIIEYSQQYRAALENFTQGLLI
ncbi:hatpase_c domain-containing protein [Stemphylium lycopersici]|uniref:Hatpase_c domain-containing protein n=1 Tax=Stemphylium lycopersici TaxID=183478 RepID=A0A364N064_STELY|nr:hatpase_c domain-containing protein [Stemphylium lycopersici]